DTGRVRYEVARQHDAIDNPAGSELEMRLDESELSAGAADSVELSLGPAIVQPSGGNQSFAAAFAIRPFSGGKLAALDLAERVAIAGHEQFGQFRDVQVASELSHGLGGVLTVVHRAGQRALGIEALEIVHEVFHAAIHRGHQLEEHRAA